MHKEIIASNIATENHQICALNATYSHKTATLGLPTLSKKLLHEPNVMQGSIEQGAICKETPLKENEIRFELPEHFYLISWDFFLKETHFIHKKK